jgi:hypothetical protein
MRAAVVAEKFNISRHTGEVIAEVEAPQKRFTIQHFT